MDRSNKERNDYPIRTITLESDTKHSTRIQVMHGQNGFVKACTSVY